MSLRKNTLRTQLKKSNNIIEKIEEIKDETKDETKDKIQEEKKEEIIEKNNENIEDLNKDKIISNLKKLNNKLLIKINEQENMIKEIRTKKKIEINNLINENKQKNEQEKKDLYNENEKLKDINMNFEKIKKNIEDKYIEEINNKQKEINDMDNNINNLLKLNEDLTEKLKEIEKKEIDKNIKIKSYKNQIIDIEEQLIQFNNTIKQLDNDLKEKEKEKEEYKNELSYVKEELLNYKNNEIEINNKKERLEIENKKLNNDLENIKNIILEKNNIIKELECKNQDYDQILKEKIKNIEIYENNLKKHMKNYIDLMKNNKFSNTEYDIICVYNQKNEYDYERKKQIYNNIFINYKLVKKEYYINENITEILTIYKYLEKFLDSEHKYLLYIGDKIEILENDIVKELNNIVNKKFNLLLLNSDEYNFINRNKDFLKINNINTLQSFIIDKKYCKKMYKILYDYLEKYYNEKINNENYIDIISKKILNDKECYLYYPEIFKIKNQEKLKIIILEEMNIENINYNYEIIRKTDLDIVYENENIKYIPEKNNFDLEILKYYYKQRKNYQHILLIKNKIKYEPNNIIKFYKNNKNTEYNILIDNKTNNIFINFKNIENIEEIFDNTNKIKMIEFNL